MKYIINIITLIVLVSLVLWVIHLKNTGEWDIFIKRIQYSFQESFKSLSKRVEAYKHNLSFVTSPERKRPLTFIENEALLREFIPQVFGNFTPQEWEDFWSMIYDAAEEEQGAVKIKRYRSKEEIESYLRYNYPNTFSYLDKGGWQYFWSIVLKEERVQRYE